LCGLLADIDWVLVGGLMVAVLEAEFGGVVGRTTTDVDIVVGVNGVFSSPRVAAERLVEVGYEPSSETEAIYRFVRGSNTVDVMAPDHLSERADIVTVPPGETIQAPGGRQALQRKRTVTVSAGDTTFEVPVPSLAGAIVMKARAATSPVRTTRDHRDLARLLVLVPDPGSMREELSSRERGYLRRLSALTDPGHEAWVGIPAAADGRVALARLSAQ
jgi:predicted nucleotidyltransferase